MRRRTNVDEMNVSHGSLRRKLSRTGTAVCSLVSPQTDLKMTFGYFWTGFDACEDRERESEFARDCVYYQTQVL